MTPHSPAHTGRKEKLLMEDRIDALEKRVTALEGQAQERYVDCEALDKGAMEILKRITTASHQQSSSQERP